MDEKGLQELISKSHDESKKLDARIKRTYMFLNWVKLYMNLILIIVTAFIAKTYGFPIASIQITHSNISTAVAFMAIVTAANIVFSVYAIRFALGLKTIMQYFLSLIVIILNIVTNPIVLHYFYYYKY